MSGEAIGGFRSALGAMARRARGVVCLAALADGRIGGMEARFRF